MEVRAVLKHVRISAQKVQRIIHAVRGKSAESALNMLKFMPQKSAGILSKIIQSAVANAEHNYGIDVDSLVVNNVMADQGPTLKRFRARARGRGSKILKRTSHITVVLAEKA